MPLTGKMPWPERMLAITFDGASEPQVAVPLGDFFGTGPGLNEFESAIHRVGSDGVLVSSWYMPYRKSVQIRLDQSVQPDRSPSRALSAPIREPPADGLASTSTPAGAIRMTCRPRKRTEPWTGPRFGSREPLAGSSACS